MAANDAAIQLVEVAFGYVFDDGTLLEEALRHRSWCAEHPPTSSNERLEFVGDAVLELIVTEWLYRQPVAVPEGVMTPQRAAVVSTAALSEAARAIGLGQHVLLGKGERATGGSDKASILADALEAVLGAIYLDGGLEAARAAVTCVLGSHLNAVAERRWVNDPKSALQELAARQLRFVPRYEVVGDGPDHAPSFEATVYGPEGALGTGTGSSKKEAEQAAALLALTALSDAESEQM